MRRLRVLSAATSLFLVVASVASVSAQSPEPVPTEAAASPASPTSPTGTSAVGNKKIIFISALLADANWQTVNQCFMDRGAQLGWDVSIVAPPNETASNPDMVNLAEQALVQQPDGIVIVPLVAAAFDNVLAQAKTAGIPVVSLGLDTSTPDQRVALVWSDNTAYGQQGADLVGQLANGEGNIGILYSGPEVSNQVASIKSFTEEIAAKFPNMKIVDPGTIISPGGDRDQAHAGERARGMLLAHPEINVIYSPDGLGGIAGALAARDLGKQPGDIIIVGSDHLPQVKADIESGWQTASLALVSCNWGSGVLDAFEQYFTGTLANDVIVTPAVLYDKDNP